MNRPTSFKLHIRPLFRDLDAEHMAGIDPYTIDLTSHGAVTARLQQILWRLKDRADPTDPTPPPSDDGPGWTNG